MGRLAFVPGECVHLGLPSVMVTHMWPLCQTGYVDIGGLNLNLYSCTVKQGLQPSSMFKSVSFKIPVGHVTHATRGMGIGIVN